MVQVYIYIRICPENKKQRNLANKKREQIDKLFEIQLLL
jgi:hypothetical protein